MPDHFHALIWMQKGDLRLGDVIGGFKAATRKHNEFLKEFTSQ
jgi:hypothetical protein